MEDSEDSDTSAPKDNIERATLNLFPEKSKKRYDLQYTLFIEWCISQNVQKYTESVILTYLSELAQKYKSSTLWSIYSMLKASLLMRHDIDLKKFKKVSAFLKKQSIGHVAKKSRFFDSEEIDTFLTEAPNEIYLLMKTLLLIGIAGACSTSELTNMTIDDVVDKDGILVFHVISAKNNKQRTFTICIFEKDSYIDICKTYFSLRPKKMASRRLFVKYYAGKCASQNVGYHTIGRVPFKIATYLKLSNLTEYTGHCFRRTSAALFSGGSKSIGIAERYAQDPMENNISLDSECPQTSTSCEDKEDVSFENCTTNFNLENSLSHIETPLSANMLCEKAKDLYYHLIQSEDFKASSGWLQSFRQMFGITETGNLSEIVTFKDKLLLKMKEMDLQLEQIYNADESGLFRSEEKITFMLCANATGSHKLRLLVLGKSQKTQKSVCYKGGRKGCITKNIFREWFHEDFVPSVRDHLQSRNLPQKALLILDNAQSHPEDLVSEDNQIVVMFITSPLRQPMDQGVTQTVKLNYRKKLQERGDSITLEKLKLKHAVSFLDEAWQRVSVELIRKSWKPLLLDNPQSSSRVHENRIKHKEAVSSFDTCITWASENDTPPHQVLLLQDLRDKALTAEINSKKEQIISDFSHVLPK